VTRSRDPLNAPRICVSFFASPLVPKDRLASWPQVWARGQGPWEELELTPQSRRLACLLALRPAGYSAGAIGRALAGGMPSKGAAQNAAMRLGDELDRLGLRSLFVRSKRGGRGARPWALHEATTDVALAAAAVGDERWVDAANLTRGGTAELVGIPSPVLDGEDWRDLPPLAAKALAPTPKGALPFKVLDVAEHTKQRVRAHRSEWENATSVPPQAQPATTRDGPAWRADEQEAEDPSSPVTAAGESAVAERSESLLELLELTQGSLTLLLAPAPGEPQHTVSVSTAPPERGGGGGGRHTVRWAIAGVVAAGIVTAGALLMTDGPNPPERLTLTIDNRVANGRVMREDDQPVVLTSRPWNRCGDRGCNISGTNRWSGGVYDGAVCQTRGESMTNGNDTAGGSADDDNPDRYSSVLFYGVRLSNGKTGYVSEVWVRERGGRSLPTCASDFTPSRPRPASAAG
jgi:hypothetical protein